MCISSGVDTSCSDVDRPRAVLEPSLVVTCHGGCGIMKGALVAVLHGEIKETNLSSSDGSPSQSLKYLVQHYALVRGGNFETLLR